MLTKVLLIAFSLLSRSHAWAPTAGNIVHQGRIGIKPSPMRMMMGRPSTTSLSTASMPLPSRPSLFAGTKNFLRNNEVACWRALFGTFFGSLILFRKSMDVQLVKIWHYLMTSSALPAKIFRTDSWEWCLAVACFFVYIHAFGWADRQVRKADEEGWVHPWKKYRLQDRFEADKHRRMMQRRGVVQDDAPPAVEQSKWNWAAWLCELPVYVVPLLIWDITAPRRYRRLAAFEAPTTLGVLGGIAGGLLLYDLFFFCGHMIMHKVPFINRTIHAKHHKVQEVRAAEIVSLSIPEEVLEVGFSIVALNLLGVHPFARTFYNAVITFLLTELHCGFDFLWTPQNVVPFGLATGSRRHHYHHRVGKHYYQKFFFTFDRIFGSYQKDDGSLHGDSVKPDPYIPAAWKVA